MDIQELAKLLERDRDPADTAVAIAGSLFPEYENKAAAFGALKELFFRPYTPSREICEKLAISRETLTDVYAMMRSSDSIRQLFRLSPYPYFIKVLEDLAADAERTLAIIGRRQPFPISKTMELFVSDSCNADCTFCYRQGRDYGVGRKMLSVGGFSALINQFADLNGESLDLCGGLEPMLGPSIADVLKTAIERKLRTVLYTNGISIHTPGLLQHLLHLDRIRVSLNAYNRNDYYKAMRVDKFAVVRDNLLDLIKHREEAKAKVRIGVSHMVTPDNLDGIHRMLRFAKEINLDFLDLRTVHVTEEINFTLYGLAKRIRSTFGIRSRSS